MAKRKGVTSPAEPRTSYPMIASTVLGIDTASKSGWAVRTSGRLIASGEADTLNTDVLAWIVARATAAATSSGTPLVCVLEAPYGGRTFIVMALGAARERWLVAFRGARIPKHRVVYVPPVVWRRDVFGARWAKAKRAAIRAHELAMAQAETGVRGLGGDEAAAIGISRWGMHAVKVAEAIRR